VNSSDTENDSSDLLRHLDDYIPSKLIELQNPNNSSNTWQPVLLWVFIVLAHLGFIAWMNKELARHPFSNAVDVVTVLEFIAKPKPKSKPKDEPGKSEIKKPVASNDLPVQMTPKKLHVVDANITRTVIAVPKNAQAPVRVYDRNGKIQLDAGFVENFDKNNHLPQRFDFQNPNLELAGTFLKRPPAIDFEPTQFDQAWKPDQDVLTELLEKAVDKTTATVKIPVPGNPTVKLECKVAILALGGACGFVHNGSFNRVVADTEDDPNTLSPQELQACQAWWNKIIDTRSQREWIKTRDLYERECKKPLAKEKSWPK
jgi:hypothetical protein